MILLRLNSKLPSAVSTSVALSRFVLIGNVTYSRFALSNAPSVAITSFTQQQVINGGVVYIQDDSTNYPSYQVTVSDGVLTTAPSLGNIDFNVRPVFANTQLSLSQGKKTLITPAMLSATDADSDAANLTFDVTTVTNGRFELASNPGVAILSFSQGQVSSSAVNFIHDGSLTAPVITLTVTDEKGSVSPVVTMEVVLLQNSPPVMVTKQLTLVEGETITLTPAMLQATDFDNLDSELTFTLTQVTAGHFEFTTGPGTEVSSFTQAQINNGEVKFIHDGGEDKPQITFQVSDGIQQSGLSYPMDVTFTNVNDAPIVLNAIPDKEVTVNEPFQFPVPATTFSDSDVGDNITLTASASNGNPLPLWLLFNATSRAFSGTAPTVGNNDFSLFARDRSNASVATNVHLKVVDDVHGDSQDSGTSEGLSIGLGVAAVFVGGAGIAASVLIYWHQSKVSTQNDMFVSKVNAYLKLNKKGEDLKNSLRKLLNKIRKCYKYDELCKDDVEYKKFIEITAAAIQVKTTWEPVNPSQSKPIDQSPLRAVLCSKGHMLGTVMEIADADKAESIMSLLLREYPKYKKMDSQKNKGKKKLSQTEVELGTVLVEEDENLANPFDEMTSITQQQDSVVNSSDTSSTSKSDSTIDDIALEEVIVVDNSKLDDSTKQDLENDNTPEKDETKNSRNNSLTLLGAGSNKSTNTVSNEKRDQDSVSKEDSNSFN